jgi:hypothetical protein
LKKPNSLLGNKNMRFFNWILLWPLFISCTKASAPATPDTNTSNADASAMVLPENAHATTTSADSLYALIQQYNTFESQLQIEKDRNQKLVAMLQTNQYASCLTKVVIKSVEININGEALAQAYVTEEYEREPTHSRLSNSLKWNDAKSHQSKGVDATGKPIGSISPIFHIRLSKNAGEKYKDKLTWTYDESKEPLFVISGEKKLEPTSTNVTIGDIDTIFLKKQSVAYLYSESCPEGAPTCSDEKKEHSISEDQRYHLTKIRLLLNNIVVYEADIDHLFAHYATPSATGPQERDTSLIFQSDIKLNAAYLQALQRQNCDGL